MEKRCKRLLEDMEDYLDIKPMKFCDLVYRDIPETSGIYIISERDIDNIVYIGLSANLRDRIYRNHLMGDSAASSLKRKLMKLKKLTRQQAKDYIKKYLFVRFKSIPEKEVKKIEHFMIAVLNPKYND